MNGTGLYSDIEAAGTNRRTAKGYANINRVTVFVEDTTQSLQERKEGVKSIINRPVHAQVNDAVDPFRILNLASKFFRESRISGSEHRHPTENSHSLCLKYSIIAFVGISVMLSVGQSDACK
ncbi:hypothetical protein C0J52_27494 [Blattella germanica]|nr:hypothetical protein C0J52_27494 [Blattella germanica]